MEKEKYVGPQMEIIAFETEDIITSSGDPELPIDPVTGLMYQ